MQRVKNQHYVPQFWLRQFTRDGSTVFVFDKASQRVFPTDARNVASENGFYDLTPEFAEDSQLVEEWLQEVEDHAASAFAHLLGDVERQAAFNHRDAPLRRMIAISLSIQDVRTLLFRKSQEQVRNLVIQELERRFGMKAPVGVAVVPDARVKFEHGKFIFDRAYLRHAIHALESHIWVVGQNDTNQPLYFSDAPVVRYPHIKERFRSTGLMTKGVEIDFPLSSRFLLMLCERTHFAPSHAQFEGRVTLLKDEHVKFCNGLQVWNSCRQIYCADDKFDLVRQYAEKQPDLFDLDRERFEIIGGVS